MEVLMTIPGIDEITAGAIIEEREGVNAGMTTLGRSAARSSSGSSAGVSGSTATGTGDEDDYSFKSPGDLMSRVPGLDTGVSQYIDTQAKTFRLVIEGRSAGITHKIQAIAEFDGKTVRYLQWREDP
jgi:hypothetical protein